MNPLTLRSLKVGNIGDDLPTADYIRSALARGLPEFTPALTFNDGHFVIVGSGPSVTSFLDEIKQERVNGRPVCAVKGTHDWLMENDFEPDLFVSCEPRERPIKKVSERCTYLIASRCAPSLFDSLQGGYIALWHAAASTDSAMVPEKPEMNWDELNMNAECEVWRGRPSVGGGTTSGLRALYLGFLLGFRKFILYGFDSCLAPDRFTKRFTGENIGESKLLDIIVGGRRFYCNGALMQQAVEFQEIYRCIPNITIEAKGDGVIAEIIKQRTIRGFRT